MRHLRIHVEAPMRLMHAALRSMRQPSPAHAPLAAELAEQQRQLDLLFSGS